MRGESVLHRSTRVVFNKILMYAGTSFIWNSGAHPHFS
jgi:hypothetical protein